MAGPLLVAGIGAGLGALGGLFGKKSADANAKTEAANQNKSNAWQHKLNSAQYETEQMPYRRQGAKTRSLRNQMAAGLVNASSSGLAKLFPGYFNLQQNYDQPAYAVQNPYAAAGAPPQMAAQKSGWSGYLGGALGGAAQGAGTALELKKLSSPNG